MNCLSPDRCRFLVHTLVIVHLDYDNVLMGGARYGVIRHLECVQRQVKRFNNRKLHDLSKMSIKKSTRSSLRVNMFDTTKMYKNVVCSIFGVVFVIYIGINRVRGSIYRESP